MPRPRAILLFERLYLGAWLTGLLATALSWQATVALLERNPDLAEIGPAFLYGTTAIRLMLPLLLWFFIARRGSAVAKWLAVGLLGLGAIGILFTIVRGAYPESVGAALGYLGFAMQFAAIVMLFRADAAAWFAEPDAEAEA